MVKKTYTLEEANKLLSALEERGRDIAGFAERAADCVVEQSFERYFEFRDKAAEFEAFCIIVEMRLENLDPEIDAKPLWERYDRCVFGVLKTLIEASLKFLYALSKKDVLPIGSKEVFLHELRSLDATRRQLLEARYADRLDEATQKNIDTAAKILAEVIDRAPALLDLENARRGVRTVSVRSARNGAATPQSA